MRVLVLVLASAALLCFTPAASHALAVAPAYRPPLPSAVGPPGPGPDVSGSFGSPHTFATHAQLVGYGFSYGPSDGQFGAIPVGGGQYGFFGAAGTTSSCTYNPGATSGTFLFTGTLDKVTNGFCVSWFGPGAGPAGWLFDRDYAGGGQVVPFASGGTSGWLMPFHGEIHWKNPTTSDGLCPSGGVPCFYGAIGLAVADSVGFGVGFRVVGQIYQPSQPLSYFQTNNRNMGAGFGSLVVADANGNHLENPPSATDLPNAYFYLFFTDFSTTAPGKCANTECLGVARALYTDVITAATSGNADKVATVFHKYDGAAPNPWTQPATSDTPSESGTSGSYMPLWTDEPAVSDRTIGSPEVIYDKSIDAYLAAYGSDAGIKVRASSDLIHWSEPIGPPYAETGHTLYQPTLMGETGDPTIGGPEPRVYFTSFRMPFPQWTDSVFEWVPIVGLTRTYPCPTPPGCSSSP